MAITEKQRVEIYAKLVDTVGEEGAEFLMTQSPPGGWEQFATKADLKEFAAEMNIRFSEVNTRVSSLEVRMEQGFAEIRSRFAELTERRSRDVWAFVAALVVIVVTVVVSVSLAG